MRERMIYITASDMERLRHLLDDEKQRPGYSNGRGDHLKGLEAELNRSTCVEDQEVLHDIITMHSTARLADLDTGEELVYTLVFPHEADFRQGRISVLAPIGTAMLGYCVGAVFEWPVPDGLRRLQVRSVVPEPNPVNVDA